MANEIVIASLIEEISRLKSRIEALENQNEALKKDIATVSNMTLGYSIYDWKPRIGS